MSPLPPVSVRLSLVVDAVFAGNVSKAATAVDVPTPTLHRIVTGQIQSPRIATIRQIADRLGVSASWLIGERSDGDEFGHSSPWRALITAYNARRAEELRLKLRHLKPRTAKARRIAAAYQKMSWEVEPPVPALNDLIDEDGDDDRFLVLMLREFGGLQAELMTRAIERVRELDSE